MQAILWPIVSWMFREILVKFVVFTAVFALVALLVPRAVGFLGSFTSAGNLSSAFSGLPGSVWFFVDAFQLGYGLPLCISAFVARFLIRRLPVIG